MAEKLSEFGARAAIKIMGIGGGGSNAVEYMKRHRLAGVELIAANTDWHALDHSEVPIKLLLGDSGLASGANPWLGKIAAVRSRCLIREHLKACDVLLIVAGLGGGTGTGASSVVATLARELGILTIGIVTSPFHFEGVKRQRIAQSGITELASACDALIVISNEKLMEALSEDVEVDLCFQAIDELQRQIAAGLIDLVDGLGLVGFVLDDIRSGMANGGIASFGLDSATGVERARVAAELALQSALGQGADLNNVGGALVVVSGRRESLKMCEVRNAVSVIKSALPDSNEVIFSTGYDSRLGEAVRVLIILCGSKPKQSPLPPTGPANARQQIAPASSQSEAIADLEQLGLSRSILLA